MFVVYRNNGSPLFHSAVDAMMQMFLMSQQDFAAAYESFDSDISLGWMPKVHQHKPTYT